MMTTQPTNTPAPAPYDGPYFQFDTRAHVLTREALASGSMQRFAAYIVVQPHGKLLQDLTIDELNELRGE